MPGHGGRRSSSSSSGSRSLSPYNKRRRGRSPDKSSRKSPKRSNSHRSRSPRRRSASPRRRSPRRNLAPASRRRSPPIRNYGRLPARRSPPPRRRSPSPPHRTRKRSPSPRRRTPSPKRKRSPERRAPPPRRRSPPPQSAPRDRHSSPPRRDSRPYRRSPSRSPPPRSPPHERRNILDPVLPKSRHHSPPPQPQSSKMHNLPQRFPPDDDRLYDSHHQQRLQRYSRDRSPDPLPRQQAYEMRQPPPAAHHQRSNNDHSHQRHNRSPDRTRDRSPPPPRRSRDSPPRKPLDKRVRSPRAAVRKPSPDRGHNDDRSRDRKISTTSPLGSKDMDYRDKRMGDPRAHKIEKDNNGAHHHIYNQRNDSQQIRKELGCTGISTHIRFSEFDNTADPKPKDLITIGIERNILGDEPAVISPVYKPEDVVVPRRRDEGEKPLHLREEFMTREEEYVERRVIKMVKSGNEKPEKKGDRFNIEDHENFEVRRDRLSLSERWGTEPKMEQQVSVRRESLKSAPFASNNTRNVERRSADRSDSLRHGDRDERLVQPRRKDDRGYSPIGDRDERIVSQNRSEFVKDEDLRMKTNRDRTKYEKDPNDLRHNLARRRKKDTSGPDSSFMDARQKLEKKRDLEKRKPDDKPARFERKVEPRSPVKDGLPDFSRRPDKGKYHEWEDNPEMIPKGVYYEVSSVNQGKNLTSQGQKPQSVILVQSSNVNSSSSGWSSKKNTLHKKQLSPIVFKSSSQRSPSPPGMYSRSRSNSRSRGFDSRNRQQGEKSSSYNWSRPDSPKSFLEYRRSHSGTPEKSTEYSNRHYWAKARERTPSPSSYQEVKSVDDYSSSRAGYGESAWRDTPHYNRRQRSYSASPKRSRSRTPNYQNVRSYREEMFFQTKDTVRRLRPRSRSPHDLDLRQGRQSPELSRNQRSYICDRDSRNGDTKNSSQIHHVFGKKWSPILSPDQPCNSIKSSITKTSDLDLRLPPYSKVADSWEEEKNRNNIAEWKSKHDNRDDVDYWERRGRGRGWRGRGNRGGGFRGRGGAPGGAPRGRGASFGAARRTYEPAWVHDKYESEEEPSSTTK